MPTRPLTNSTFYISVNSNDILNHWNENSKPFFPSFSNPLGPIITSQTMEQETKGVTRRSYTEGRRGHVHGHLTPFSFDTFFFLRKSVERTLGTVSRSTDAWLLLTTWKGSKNSWGVSVEVEKGQVYVCVPEREKMRASVWNEEFHVTTTAAVRSRAAHSDPSTSTLDTPPAGHRKRPSDTDSLTKHTLQLLGNPNPTLWDLGLLLYNP